MDDNNQQKIKGNSLKSKQRLEVLDGLRGVASVIVVLFHIFEIYSGGPKGQIINHGYLAVDFFYLLSGFVIGYAYDDRWNKMSYWDFYKRRLIRLHPMVVAGTFFGICYYFLSETYFFPNIKDINPFIFFLAVLMSLLNIPTPPSIDLRGFRETNGLNGASWTLNYEYLINILYSLIFRRLHDYTIAILTFLSGLLIMTLTLNIDIFGVLLNREERKYTVIGGWEITLCEVYIAFVRLFFPFFCGYLISRLKTTIKMPYSFTICSLILSAVLCLPRVGGNNDIMNGLYETIVIILIFPIIVMIGAGSNEKNKIIISICKFLGEFSYPLYITHNPIIYCNYAWTYYHTNDPSFNRVTVSVGIFIIIMFNTYAVMKLYDEPVRKWLTNKYLIKKLPSIEDIENIDYKIINKQNDKEENKKLINDIIN